MYIRGLLYKKFMKKFVFIFLLILSFACSSLKTTSKTKSKDTKEEVIRFDKFSRMATILSTSQEKVQSIYLYDKERNLIKSFEDVKVNRLLLSVQGVYLINVVTDKGLHIKVIR